MITSQVSEKVATWIKRYMYRALKLLLGIKANVSIKKLFRACMGITEDEFVNREYLNFCKRWLSKHPEECR